VAAVPAPDEPEPWRAKVAAPVLEAAADGDAEFLVVLDGLDARASAAGAGTKAERGRAVVDALQEQASRTQAPLLAWLDRHGVEHRSFWVANFVWVRGDGDVLRSVAERPEVRRVEANPRVSLPPPAPAPGARATSGIEWNVVRVEADQVWNLGFEGQGVVVGGQDTGYDWDHPALVGTYRGWDGASASHAYSWHDAIHAGGGVCGPNSNVPCDDHYHGTHTMGTIVGDDGGTNRIGVAPAARWIGCRNMDEGDGTPVTYAECFQWFLAPGLALLMIEPLVSTRRRRPGAGVPEARPHGRAAH